MILTKDIEVKIILFYKINTVRHWFKLKNIRGKFFCFIKLLIITKNIEMLQLKVELVRVTNSAMRQLKVVTTQRQNFFQKFKILFLHFANLKSSFSPH